MAIEKIKILGALLELPAKKHSQSSPFTSKLGQIGSAVLDLRNYLITMIILISISEIVECAGGQYIPKMPLNNDENTFVVSCEADKKVLTKAIKAGIKIQNKEVILTGLLRQKVEFDKHGLVV